MDTPYSPSVSFLLFSAGPQWLRARYLSNDVRNFCAHATLEMLISNYVLFVPIKTIIRVDFYVRVLISS